MGELPQVLAGHLLPAAPATAPAPGAMLVPLPGTPAFQEWTASLLDEARRQRCTKGGQKSTYWNALRCMAMTRRRNPRRRAAACSAVGRSTGVERLAVPHGAATISPDCTLEPTHHLRQCAHTLFCLKDVHGTTQARTRGVRD